MEEEDFRKHEKLPIYQKAIEIYDLVHQIADLIPEDNEHLITTKQFMLADAGMLSTKIAGAEAGGHYDLKMEAAAIIRKSAKDLMLHNHSPEAFGFKETSYYQLVRDQIEEFRLLYIDWVASFDQWDYVIDRWGLFNPPGVGPFDSDPDDLIGS